LSNENNEIKKTVKLVESVVESTNKQNKFLKEKLKIESTKNERLEKTIKELQQDKKDPIQLVYRSSQSKANSKTLKAGIK
jgi:predicted transcriptional regulator